MVRDTIFFSLSKKMPQEVFLIEEPVLLDNFFSYIVDRPFPSQKVCSLFLGIEIKKNWNREAFFCLRAFLKDDLSLIPSFAEELYKIFYEMSLLGEEVLMKKHVLSDLFSFFWKRSLDVKILPHQLLHQDGHQEGNKIVCLGLKMLSFVHIQLLKRVGAKLFLLFPTEVSFVDSFFYSKGGRGLSLEEEENQFLLFWGELGSNLQENLSDVSSIEEFCIPEGDSLLSRIQRDILRGNHTPWDIMAQDQSLQIIQAPNQIREVEVVKDLIVKFLYEEGGSSLEKIIIAAPSIQEYHTSLESIFSQGENSFSLTLMNIPRKKYDLPYIILEQLFSLPQKGFPFAQVLLLGKTMDKFSQQEVEKIEKYIQHFPQAHGLNACYMQKVYGVAEAEGTLLSVCEEIIASLVQPAPVDLLIEDIELFDRFFCFLQQLERDLSPMWMEEWQLNEWIAYIVSCSMKYAGVQLIEQDVWSFLKEGSYEIFSNDVLLPFSMVLPLVDGLLSRGGKYNVQGQRSGQEKILCCNISQIPAGEYHLVVLLGLDASYPKEPAKNIFFEELYKNFPLPSSELVERWYFLHALLTPSKALLLSYSGNADNTSFFVDKLQEIVFEKYHVSVAAEKHPLSIADPKYFAEVDSLFTLSWEGFQAFSSPPFVDICFFFDIPWTIENKTVTKLPIENLISFAKRPLDFFCKQSLGLNFFKVTPPEEFPFKASKVVEKCFYENSLLKGQADPPEMTHLPKSFQHCLLDSWTQDVKEFYEFYSANEECEFFYVHLHSCYQKIQQTSSSSIGAPPLFSALHNISIEGELGPFSKKGVLWLFKKDQQNPLLQGLYSVVAEHINISPTWGVSFEDQKLVQHSALLEGWLDCFLTLYLQGCVEPCPVRGEWLESIAHRQVDVLQKKIKTLQGSSPMGAWGWVLHYFATPKSLKILDRWQPVVAPLGGSCV